MQLSIIQVKKKVDFLIIYQKVRQLKQKEQVLLKKMPF
jgi:hypothetical protein